MRQKYRKILKNVQKSGKNRQIYRKIVKLHKNAEKSVKNVPKSRKKSQKYRKIVKNVEKR